MLPMQERHFCLTERAQRCRAHYDRLTDVDEQPVASGWRRNRNCEFRLIGADAGGRVRLQLLLPTGFLRRAPRASGAYQLLTGSVMLPASYLPCGRRYPRSPVAAPADMLPGAAVQPEGESPECERFQTAQARLNGEYI